MIRFRSRLRWLAFMVWFVVASCAPAKIDTAAVQQHIAAAEVYVGVAFSIADTCIAARLAVCSGPAFAAGVAKAKAVATEAIQQAKDVAATDGTQAQTLLRAAMNAVLLFYSLR